MEGNDAVRRPPLRPSLLRERLWELGKLPCPHQEPPNEATGLKAGQLPGKPQEVPEDGPAVNDTPTAALGEPCMKPPVQSLPPQGGHPWAPPHSGPLDCLTMRAKGIPTPSPTSQRDRAKGSSLGSLV